MNKNEEFPEEVEEGSFVSVDAKVLRRIHQDHEQALTHILLNDEIAPDVVTVVAAKASAKSWVRDNGLILSDGSIGATLPNGRAVRYREGGSLLHIDDTNDELVAVIRQWAEPRDEDADTLKAQLEQSPSWKKCLEHFPIDDLAETPGQRLVAMQDRLNRFGLPYTPTMARYALSCVDRTQSPCTPTRGGIVTTFVLAICYDLLPLPSGFTYKRLYEYEVLQQTVAPANWTTSAFRERAESLLTQHSKSVNAWGEEFKQKITGDLRGLNKRDASQADPELYADVDACIAGELDRQEAKDRAIARLEASLNRRPSPDEKNRAKKRVSDLIYSRSGGRKKK